MADNHSSQPSENATDQGPPPSPPDAGQGQDGPVASGQPRGSRKPLLLLLAVVAVVAVIYLVNKSRQTAAESAAKDRLNELGVIVTLDDSQTHVQIVQLLPSITSEKLDEVIKLLPKLPYMDLLRIAGTPVTDAQLDYVAQCGSLTSLGLNRTTIGDAGVNRLAGLDQLTALYLSDTPVTAGSLEAIGTLTGLQILSLVDTQVDGDLAPLAGLENLEHLLLSGVDLSDEAMATISRLPKLTRLTIKGSAVSDAAIEKLKKAKTDIGIDQ
jgi:hypothetical protein